MGRRVYIDTNVFIAAYERRHAHVSAAWLVFNAVESGDLVAFTSELSYAELLPKLIADRQDDMLSLYEGLFDNAELFDVVPVTRQVLVKAARLRSTRMSLKLPDAIHLATAVLSSCCAVLSYDQRLATTEAMPVVAVEAGCLATIRAMP